MLAAGASVNLYMGHGGTNFGLWNGANSEGGLQPTVTSYDYDSPVSEAGELTEKFWAFRDVIAKYAPVPEMPASLLTPPAPLPAQALPVRGWAPLLDSPGACGPAVRSPVPLPMEDVGSGRGLIVYRGSVLVPPDGRDLILDGLADRAIVFADGERAATLSPDHAAAGVRLSPRPDGQPTRLEVLVDNRGRVNFGHRLGDRKGVTGIRLATASSTTGTACRSSWTPRTSPPGCDSPAPFPALRPPPCSPRSPRMSPLPRTGFSRCPAGAGDSCG